jgi:hypothetical protein
MRFFDYGFAGARTGKRRLHAPLGCRVGGNHALDHAVPIPSVRATLMMPIPLARSLGIRASTAGLVGGRPSALARASPAFTRSRIMARSNSEDAAHLEYRSSRRRAGIKRLLMQVEVTIECV